MEANYESFEVVSIYNAFSLIDAEAYQRQYQTPDNQPLPVGYYVVHWPFEVAVRRFDSEALFHGPFVSRMEANLARDRLAMSSLSDHEQGIVLMTPKVASGGANDLQRGGLFRKTLTSKPIIPNHQAPICVLATQKA